MRQTALPLSEFDPRKLFSFDVRSIDVFAQVATEYDLASCPDLPEAPVILDIGANCGAFAVLASRRYPGARVHAFEPHPRTFRLLAGNVSHLPVTCYDVAVLAGPRRTAVLYEGLHADTECSVRDDVVWSEPGGGQHQSQRLDLGQDVRTYDASELPAASLVKIDTEGSEVEILTAYAAAGHLPLVSVLLVEVHAVGGDLQGQADQIGAIAQQAGLLPESVRGGTIRFFRRPTTVWGARS